MKLPVSLRPYAEKAKATLLGGKIGHIEFSGSTYQVQVFDPMADKEGFWAFLQLGSKGHLRDSFCTCEESERERGCAHLAAAYLRIYNGHSSPLHHRFERSLWNALARSYMEILGDSSQLVIQERGGRYQCEGAKEEPIFECQGKTAEAKKFLEALFSQQKRETEETSLKFSDLTEEELLLWRQGRPPPQLRYELSYWGDLAKWMMQLQEEGSSYTLTFDYGKQGLPNRINITFEALKASFALSKQVLAAIIPTLSTVKAPLKVHRTEMDAISRIIYDGERGVLKVIPKEGVEEGEWTLAKEHPEYLIEGWYFVPGDGFYAVDRHQLLATPVIEGEAICRLFHNHFHVVEALLEGVSLHRDPVPLSYSCRFDEQWNLHITAYLFEEGDLLLPQSRLFGSCAYIEGSGFYFVEERNFDEIDTLITRDNVADFVTGNRGWLNLQEGYETHLLSIEAELAYELTEEYQLHFMRQLTLAEEEGGESCKDFGAWVYLHGQGFFSKTHTTAGLSVRPGTVINVDQIPLFIRSHRQELSYVPKFFSKECPVKAAKLEITVISDNEVRCTPYYTFHPPYYDKKPLLFDDVTYVEGEGFYELPVALRLPEGFREPVTLKGNNLFHFLKFGLEELTHYIEELDPRLMKVEPKALVAEKVTLVDEARRDRYRLKLTYASEQGKVPLSDLWHAYSKKEKYLLTDAGFIDLTENRYRWIDNIEKRQIDRRSNTLEMTAMELLKLDSLERIGGGKQLLEELRTFEVKGTPPFPALKSHLRNYQEQGLCWLWFLFEHGLSGLLCDDMGLGKTHQAMALIAALKAAGRLENRVVVICPTSVIYHWEEKIKEFLPSIPAFTYHGVSRSLKKLRDEERIIITSYGVWRNEVEQLKGYSLDLAILDEVQVAKNHRSRTHKALLQIKAPMRLGMTGTPIENALRELKALFDLLLPGYMPSDERFREEFVKPIERYGDEGRRHLLSRYVKPFILRRKKEDVLSDLPEKTEEVAHCDLAPEQLDLYNAVLAQAHRKVLLELQNNENPIPYIHIFAILSNLKQICDHPAVYHKDPDNYQRYQSGKWDLFLELFSEARDSNQKVVIFSQYLTMLDIFESYLKDEGIGYATIRGSTVKRGEQIKKFNTDPDCEVFLGSLQAAGLGVDLTAGSVVIHYDRWWNAARENQATDRVHRIGQQRGVQVFKLVTKNSFEERIDTLILKKGKLLEEVVGVDDHNFVKQFNRDELVELLQYIDRGVL